MCRGRWTEVKKMKAKLTWMWKALDFEMIFLAVLPQFISPDTLIPDP